MQAPSPSLLFDNQEWRQLRQFLDTLNQRQALWLSGYLAGNSGQLHTPLAPQKSTSQPVLIAFGTETNNCFNLAQRLGELCQASGIASEIADLATLRPRKLSKVETLIVITATHGDGDPPEPIVDFYESVMADDAPRLESMKYAVLALGDSSYEHFCTTGISLDQRFESLGAVRLIPRQDCDVDFEQAAARWMEQLLETLPRPATGVGSTTGSSGPIAASEYGKDHPITVEVLTNQRLSHPDRDEPTHHLELALEAPDFPLSPGDAVGIFAENPPELVALILDATGLSGEQPVMLDDRAIPLVEGLRQYRDLTVPGKAFLEMWARLSESEALSAILKADNQTLRRYLRESQIRDLLLNYSARPEPQEFFDALRPLQPRLYDLANSLSVVPDELHLTVKAFSYRFGSRQEFGIASNYLLELQPGDSLRLYPHKNVRFRLPEPTDSPLILIAEGTGIAPFRAFLQSLSLLDKAPPCWLIFAEECFEDDFIYQLDIQKAQGDGVLSHIDTVFYSDTPGISLATPILAQSKRLVEWLKQGAHLYFCGDKASLDTCEADLAQHIDKQVGEGQWKQLSKDKRIHRNMY